MHQNVQQLIISIEPMTSQPAILKQYSPVIEVNGKPMNDEIEALKGNETFPAIGVVG